MYCVIPMSTLTAAGATDPYAYTFDQLVVVRATAHNSYGYSTTPSPSNTVGAKIRKVPD